MFSRKAVVLAALTLTGLLLMLSLAACERVCDTDERPPCNSDGDQDVQDGDLDDSGEEPQPVVDGDLDEEETEGGEWPEQPEDGDLTEDDTGEEEELEEETEEPEDVDPGYDDYYGSLRYQTDATGFFRVARIDGQWWLITPEGHPFFSTGLNVLGYTGTCTRDGVCHYRDNMDTRYESRQDWADDQIPRVWDWGWNTVGAWSDWQLFAGRYPYTIIVYIARANMTENGPLDFFSDEFRELARSTIVSAVTPNVDDPYLIGYFFDNEMHWGFDLWRGKHLFDEYIKMDSTRPGKQRLVQMLRERYGTVAALNRDFRADTLADFTELLEATELKSRGTEGAQAAKAAFNGLVAEAYFSITDGVFREVDPNHLNLGVRFVSQMIPRSVIEVAGRYVDVMSINWYDLIPNLANTLVGLDPEYLPVNNWLYEQYQAGGRPILISEWGYRSKDGGPEMNTYPPIYPTLEDTEARADAYEEKFRGMLEREWFVGQHWFLFADQPPEGRFDGEDNNFGIVTEEDVPYEPLVQRSALMHAEMYRRLPPMPQAE